MSIFDPLVKQGICRYSELLEILEKNGEGRDLVWSANIWLNCHFVNFPPRDLAKLLSPEKECHSWELAIFHRGTNHWKLKRSVFKDNVDKLTYAQLLVVFQSKSDDLLPTSRDLTIIAILNCFSKEKDKGCSRNRDNSPARK